MKAKTSFSLKDQLFNAKKVDYLANLIQRVFPAFETKKFRNDVIAPFPSLELKARIAHITNCLEIYLPDDYIVALETLLRALPPELDPNKTDDDFGDFIFAPLSFFVATHGCTEEYLNISLNALKTITKRFSAEDAIRYFLNAFPDQTLDFLLDCTTDENYHVRRLASEGTRPKLPWSQKLSLNYRQPLPILENLYADNTRYVTRSVANHLNDISKLDAPLVIQLLQKWQSSKEQSAEEMAFITKHSVRTLLKQNHPDALQLMGFGATPEIEITEFSTSTPKVRIGESFLFSITIYSHKPQKLLIDYLMKYPNTGKKQSQKVFKIKQLELVENESVTLQKTHPMRLMTTRRQTLGKHDITLHINGQAFGNLSFELI
ncbi:DNA alkylation repair protein [[Limnothrix rosea] IAM M-220]|uniref:DNA alkylation repair protein n=1 Tax=[Limnothrix rosea] IAM M-220 TaxID=454133 RepID=UPI00095D1F64|nr:DNA alkylation repair protein [[Limnothrix rosea] IAM M-220]OKH18897.1 DNA alkylation repair protein [[Limnothrix rosea] IAM M-220]